MAFGHPNPRKTDSLPSNFLTGDVLSDDRYYFSQNVFHSSNLLHLGSKPLCSFVHGLLPLLPPLPSMATTFNLNPAVGVILLK